MPTTFSTAPIRAAIKAKVAGVANIGQVHDYERFAKEAAKLLAQYSSAAQTGTRIYGWFVALRAVRERYLDIARAIIDCDWKLFSYMGVDDADETEKKLAVQIELVRDAFRNDDDLGGVIDTQIIDSGGGIPIRGVQVDEIEHVMFCNVLCHRARCSLTTRSYVLYTA